MCRILGALVVLTGLALLAAWIARPAFTVAIGPGELANNSGQGYLAALEPEVRFPYTVGPDSNADPGRSNLILYEDGHRLGPAHANHAAIAEKGRGAYSHWGAWLRFSSSDNTDPRTNGRRYVAHVTAELRPTLIWAGAFLLLAYFTVARRRENRKARSGTPVLRATELFLAGVTLASVILVNRDIYVVSDLLPILAPDSLGAPPVAPGYVALGPVRGYLYPGLLQLLRRLEPDGWLIIPVQLNLMLLSFLVLGHAAARIARNRMVGWLTALLLVWNAGLVQQSLALLSEAPFIALVSLHLAAALHMLRRFTSTSAAAAGATAALAILVRPAGYGLLLGLPVLALFSVGHRRAAALSTAAAAGLILLAGSVPNLLKYGTLSTHTFGGLSLLGHVLPLATPDAKGPYPELLARIANKTVPVVSSRHAAYPHDYWIATASQYNMLLWVLAAPEIAVEIGVDIGRDHIPADAIAKGNDIALRLAETIVLNDLPGYLRHVAAHIYGMWYCQFAAYGPLSTAVPSWQPGSRDIHRMPAARAYFGPGALALAERKAAETGEPARLALDAVWPAVQPVAQGLRIVLPVLTILSIGMAFYGLFRGRRDLRLVAGLAFCAVQIWAYFGFVAAVQAALARYSLVLEPVTTVFVTLCGAVLLARATAVARRAAGAIGWPAPAAGHVTT